MFRFQLHSYNPLYSELAATDDIQTTSTYVGDERTTFQHHRVKFCITDSYDGEYEEELYARNRPRYYPCMVNNDSQKVPRGLALVQILFMYSFGKKTMEVH